MPAKNINEVISQLEAIIADAIKNNSRLGYFAALYHKVTCKVKEGIDGGEFEDGQRMELFDVTFANRYLDAYQKWQLKQPVTASWQVAFQMAEKSSVLVLQHLLMGMNAHINLDLGIAVVELAKKQNCPLQQMHKDFNSINTILAALTYEVINELDQVSPLLSLAGLHSKNDSLFIQFALGNARDGAWCFAEELYDQQTEAGYQGSIQKRDTGMAQLGSAIVDTKGLLKFTVWLIHLFERKTPSKITSVLGTYKKTYFKVDATGIKTSAGAL